MSRQSVLIWILVALVMFGLPVHYMDAAMTEGQGKLEAETAKLEPLRREVAAGREREAQLAERARKLEAVQSRLIQSQPFASIQSELAAAAAKSGVTLGALMLEGPAAVAELPEIVRYQATLQVSGNRAQYLEFLKLLENHRLLIELPEVSLRTGPAARGVQPQVQQALALGFYAARGKK
ncbi:MAG TPA: hypothetical protein VNT75_27145 [Symbiobacteriaceae bacterium]|nr:hypothetical protein [Symbiobacteriaceae bacterium]